MDEIATKRSTWEKTNLGVVAAVKSCYLISFHSSSLLEDLIRGDVMW